MKVVLNKILEALGFINSENAAYVNVKNGKVVLLSDSDISAAEDDSYHTQKNELVNIKAFM